MSFYNKSKEGISHVSVLTRSSYFFYPVQFPQSWATPSEPFVDPDSTLIEEPIQENQEQS